ncbi:L,D-transpeptidase [Thermosynechococcaceae cyanobacterium BACA0444]|uniref:L,D-transpeptidase n=1 Tax=Pseudocalidococcus azoricus BACA0444 TaxID=2918990 RepID=A0AAE4FR47_9CYAN|nr:L,D-transpeptidase [Pseudocalidococcus azoricus]MDS3860615.1 L,D-transpeptidase [Pseudocalidococcus azoricus BACA0444]
MKWLCGGIVAVAWGILSLAARATPVDYVASQRGLGEPSMPMTGLAWLELPPLQESTPFLPDLERKIVLKLRERRVYLYVGEQVQASYPVAVGKPGWETPTGTFKVMHMVKNPTWKNPFNGTVVPPGPANPLGDRLIVFTPIGNKGYAGFHGTTNESLIGQAVSHGCVRMKNNDIRAFFEAVELGTPVIVKP